MIPCASPHAQYLVLKDEIQSAIHEVLEKGYYVLGEQTKLFEKEFAAYVGVSDFVGVANGTDALQLALVAAGLQPGDEVITTSHTAVATVSAIVQAGGKPVLADIESDFFTLDPNKVKAMITPKTKAIIAVHIYGQPCDMHSFLEIAKAHNLVLIEDCAQAHGARWNGKMVGSIGHVGCFSFYPTKNLGAIGDGGGVATSDPKIAEKLRLLRQYGWKERYVSAIHGWNSRLDELQAAILRVKLRYLDAENATRKKLANLYHAELGSLRALKLPETRAGAEHVFHLYATRSEKRNELMKFLLNEEVQTLVHYPMPIHLQPGYQKICRHENMNVTEAVALQELSFPMHPYLSDSDALRVCAAVKKFFSAHSA